MTNFENEKVRGIQLCLHPLEGEIMEVLVFDNELPIYHTTSENAALRMDPLREEAFGAGNIKKILVDKDVGASKGKESLKWLCAISLSRLEFICINDDLAELIEDWRWGLGLNLIDRIPELFEVWLFSWSCRNWQARAPDKKSHLKFVHGHDHFQGGGEAQLHRSTLPGHLFAIRKAKEMKNIVTVPSGTLEA